MEWPLLASLDEAERQRILARTRQRVFERGDTIVQEGDPSDSLHLVTSGRVAVRVSTTDGETVTINLLGPGDYFGELSLLDGQPAVRSATIVALEKSQTLALSASEFRTLRARHPAADRLLLTLMARRIEELSARLLEATYDSLDRRVHRRLVELADLYGDRSGPVTVPLTQERLAELATSSRSPPRSDAATGPTHHRSSAGDGRARHSTRTRGAPHIRTRQRGGRTHGQTSKPAPRPAVRWPFHRTGGSKTFSRSRSATSVRQMPIQLPADQSSGPLQAKQRPAAVEGTGRRHRLGAAKLVGWESIRQTGLRRRAGPISRQT